jgi:hypothetical protein
VFDPATIADRATFDDPHQHPQGIDHVLMNGTPVIAAGQDVADLNQPLPGRALCAE